MMAKHIPSDASHGRQTETPPAFSTSSCKYISAFIDAAAEMRKQQERAKASFGDFAKWALGNIPAPVFSIADKTFRTRSPAQ